MVFLPLQLRHSHLKPNDYKLKSPHPEPEKSQYLIPDPSTITEGRGIPLSRNARRHQQKIGILLPT